MRYLVVEDEYTSGQQLKFFLEDMGNCDLVETGNAAIEKFKEALSDEIPYDLVCLDIDLPGKNGVEVLKEIKAIEASYGIGEDKCAKVFMTTASADRNVVATVLKYKCSAYMIKPVLKHKLIMLMKDHNVIG